MGILKKIKFYFHRKNLLNKLQTKNIVNQHLYDKNNPTIVFISRGFPTHDKDSGSNRLKEIIFLYKELGYNCIICAEKIFEDNSYVSFYKRQGIIVYVENKKFSDFFKYLKSVPKIDIIWYNSANSFAKFFPKMKNYQARQVFDMVDIHFLRYKRAIDLEPLRLSLKKDYKKYFYIETKLSQKADVIISISDREKNIIKEYVNEEKIITISNIHYPKIKKEERNDFYHSENILFIGSIHPPNIDAVKFMYEQIMPKVWNKAPFIKVFVIGNVKDCIDVKKYPKFEFLGYVENIEPLFKTSKLMVAPLRFGAGVKGKIGQAFEYYLPVVTTSIGAEGMYLENEQNAYIADDENNLAKAILEVYSDENKWNRLSENSINSLNPFSLEEVKENLKKIL